MPTLNLSGNNNTLWTVYDYTKLSSRDGDYVYADEDDDNKHQEWNVSEGSLNSGGTITDITVTIYHRYVDSGFPESRDVTVNFGIDGVFQGDKVSTTSGAGWAEDTLTWSSLSISVPDFINLVLQIDPENVPRDFEYQLDEVIIEVSGSGLTGDYPWDSSGVCEQYMIPLDDKPSYFGPTGVVNFPTVSYSGGNNWRNSNDLSYYEASGDNSFSYYVQSGHYNPDDSTYVVGLTGIPDENVQNFMFQGSPLYVAPDDITLYIRASGFPATSTFYLGNSLDPSGQINLEIKMVGPTGDYAIIANLDNPIEMVGFTDDWEWFLNDGAGVTEGISITPSDSGIQQALNLNLFEEAVRTEVKGSISIVDHVNTGIVERFGLSEISLFFDGNCPDNNNCNLFIGGNEVQNSGVNLYTIAKEDNSGNIPLYTFNDITEFEELELSIIGGGGSGEPLNLFIHNDGEASGNLTLYTAGPFQYQDENDSIVNLNTYSSYSHNESLNLYIGGTGNFSVGQEDPGANSINLHIETPGFTTVPDDSGITLFMNSDGVYTTLDNTGNMPTLYIANLESTGEGLNLFIFGSGYGEIIGTQTLHISGSITNNNIPLYIQPTIEHSGDLPLFITSFYEDSGGMNLYLDQYGGINRKTETLFVEGKYDNSSNVELFIGSATKSGIMPLFVKSRDFIPDEDKSADLFIYAQTGNYLFDTIPFFARSANDEQMNLFIKSIPNLETDDYINLVINGSSGNYSRNLTELFLKGGVQSISGISMFMPNPGKIDYSDNMNLFINRAVNSIANQTTLYLQSKIFNSEDTTLYISGVPTINDNLTLFIDSTAFGSGNPTLYTHGY